MIFDLDGTLADTLDDLTDSINVVFEEHGLPGVTRERIRAQIGHGLRNLLARASGVEDAAKLEALIEQYRVVYRERMFTRTRLFEGIAEMLGGLARRGIPMSLLSNKPDEFTGPLCERLLSRWRFVAVRGARDEAERKPDATLALQLAEAMKRSPEEVYFVGDSATDVQTGRNAGMICVGVLWGYRSCEELAVERPDFLIDAPTELLSIVATDGDSR